LDRLNEKIPAAIATKETSKVQDPEIDAETGDSENKLEDEADLESYKKDETDLESDKKIEDDLEEDDKE
jgi:hypothetical protein